MLTDTLPTYREIKLKLGELVPARLISHRKATRAANSPEIDYININDYKDLLDFRAGVWESTIVDFKQIGESLCVNVRISIHASDGVFHQDGSGIEPLSAGGYGDAFSNSYAQAFRRACEGHGLSRELWRSDESERHFRAKYNAQIEKAKDPGGVGRPRSAASASYDLSPEPMSDNEAAQHFGKPAPQTAAQPAAPTTSPSPDVIGHGAAKKKELKLRTLCTKLNSAGSQHEGAPWNSEALEAYCQSGFDKSLAQIDEDETAILIQDLTDTLAEREALTSEEPTVVDAGETGEAATEQQVAALYKLCELKRVDAPASAQSASGNRTDKFEDLTKKEAEAAIMDIGKK